MVVVFLFTKCTKKKEEPIEYVLCSTNIFFPQPNVHHLNVNKFKSKCAIKTIIMYNVNDLQKYRNYLWLLFFYLQNVLKRKNIINVYKI